MIVLSPLLFCLGIRAYLELYALWFKHCWYFKRSVKWFEYSSWSGASVGNNFELNDRSYVACWTLLMSSSKIKVAG